MQKTNTKKIRFEKDFIPNSYFIVYVYEAILAPLKEYHAGSLTYFQMLPG